MTPVARRSIGTGRSSQSLYSDSDDDVPLIANVRSSSAATQSKSPRLVVRIKKPKVTKPTSKKKNVKKSSKKGKKSLHVSRGSGFSNVETLSFLRLLEEHLPIGNSEWEHVVTLHDKNFSAKMRTVDSLKRKFATLHRRKIPTGNPIIPEDVSLAKEVRSKITQRSEIGTADNVSDQFDDDSEDSSDDEDSDENNSSVINIEDGDVPGEPDNEVNVEDSFFGTQFEPIENVGASTALLDAPSTPCANNTMRASPKPLVHRRSQARSKKEDDDDILSLLKAQIMIDGIRKEEEHKRHQQERQEREEERKAERARREEDVRRQDKFMQMMMIAMMNGKINTDDV